MLWVVLRVGLFAFVIETALELRLNKSCSVSQSIAVMAVSCAF